MVQIYEENRRPSFAQSIMQGLTEGIAPAIQYYQKSQQDAERRKQLQELTGINAPEEFQKMAYEYGLKGGLENKKIADKLRENEQLINSIEQERGLPKGSLSGYASDPALAERITKPPKKTQASQPIDQEQLNLMEKVRSNPDFEDLDELGQYRAFTSAGVSKENAEAESKLRGNQLERQSKEFDNSYKAQESFINDVTDSYKGFETEMKPRLLQMQNIPAEDIIGPTAAVFLEQMGIPLGALDNPSSELYNKLSQDMLKGLPETYGSRILKVEVDNFLKTIPQLINSADGRRMISSNMLKLGELKEVYYKEMRRQQKDHLDNRKPLPKDFQQRVFDQVKPQIDKLNNEFVQLSEVKSVPKGTIPFFGPNGIEFVPKEHAQWALENGGKRIW